MVMRILQCQTDSYIREQDIQVLECIHDEHGYALQIDQACQHGGGQPRTMPL